MGAELTSRVPAIERRASLVRAALDIALEEGVAAVTTRSVCARANAHLGVFHYCFSGKGELLDLMYGETVSMLLGKFEEENVDTVSDFLRAVLKLLVDEWEHVYILNELVIFSSRVKEEGDQGMAALRYFEAFIEGTEFQLERCAERGGFRWAPNVRTPARIIVHSLFGVATARIIGAELDAGSFEFEETMNTYLSMLEALQVPN